MTLRSVPPSIGEDERSAQRMWHVTVTVSGAPEDAQTVREALERLNVEHPFLLEARYSPERAEICYWEEAQDMDTAAKAATTMWSDNVVTARLPSWEVIGLQVLDRATYVRREPLRAVSGGRIVPFSS